MSFNVEKTTTEIIEWIKNYFEENGKTCNAIIGISGGKDSTVCAALLVKALGANRVIGVTMPDGTQSDLSDSFKVIEILSINHVHVNIGNAKNELMKEVENAIKESGLAKEVKADTKINMPPRLRMTTLFAVSQTLNGRVVNTCNLSENWIGYSTLFGDAAGQFSPLGNLTVKEVIEIGKHIGLPVELVEKKPSDGLCGKTDEDNIGFTYDELDNYIRTGEKGENFEKINELHLKNMFKLKPMPHYKPDI